MNKMILLLTALTLIACGEGTLTIDEDPWDTDVPEDTDVEVFDTDTDLPEDTDTDVEDTDTDVSEDVEVQIKNHHNGETGAWENTVITLYTDGEITAVEVAEEVAEEDHFWGAHDEDLSCVERPSGGFDCDIRNAGLNSMGFTDDICNWTLKITTGVACHAAGPEAGDHEVCENLNLDPNRSDCQRKARYTSWVEGA